jgi:anti-sigma B factor antagonist
VTTAPATEPGPATDPGPVTDPGTVRIDGELTVLTAADHLQALLAVVTVADEIEADLSGVSELDTAGLQVLLLVRSEADRQGKDFRLARPADAVLEVLEIAGLTVNLEPR